MGDLWPGWTEVVELRTCKCNMRVHEVKTQACDTYPSKPNECEVHPRTASLEHSATQAHTLSLPTCPFNTTARSTSTSATPSHVQPDVSSVPSLLPLSSSHPSVPDVLSHAQLNLDPEYAQATVEHARPILEHNQAILECA